MSCVASASTNAIMQSKYRATAQCEEVCTYVIVGDSNAGLLLVSSALSMSHLGRWNCPCLLIALAWGPSKQATCSPLSEACFRRPSTKQGDIMPRHACNICALQIGLQGEPGPSQLTSGTV
jgi:hypothetical protein